MSNPKDTITVTFTREELELIWEVFTRNDHCYHVEEMMTGKCDQRICGAITRELRKVFFEEQPCEDS